MSAWSRVWNRLRSAYREDGLRGVISLVAGYSAWKAKGSPDTADDGMDDRLDRVEAAATVMLLRDWYQTATPLTSPLVSVILPTRDRADLLVRAVRSVHSQTFENWELILIDDTDSGAGAPNEVLADTRIQVLSSGGVGVGAARNQGLDAAKGHLISYLDDDNVMDRHWLKSIVLTFEEHPDAEVMIGAQAVWPEPGATSPHRIRFPAVFDWQALTRANFVDMGMLAHRTQSEFRFSTDLPAFVDWDFIVRLTKETDPVLAPALSGIYFTGADDRISYQDRERLLSDIRTRFEGLAPPTEDAWKSGSKYFEEDRRALAGLIQRRQSERSKVLRVLLLGESQYLTRLSSYLPTETKATIRNRSGTSTDSSHSPYDIVIIDGLSVTEANGMTADDGIIIGLNADGVPYEQGELEFSRRVGDQMWIGSRENLDMESLFDGSTLVKFGVPSRRTGQG